jgi:hypothetical protein
MQLTQQTHNILEVTLPKKSVVSCVHVFAYHIVLEFRIGNVRLYYYGIVVKLDSLEFTLGF